MQNLVTQLELSSYVESRGFRTERVFNTTSLELDGAELLVVALNLFGPRGNKGFLGLTDGRGDLNAAKLWCDGVDYSTARIKDERARRKRT